MIDWTLLFYYRFTFSALVILCLALDAWILSRWFRTSPRSPAELLFKLLGSNFFLLYIGLRAVVQIDDYHRYPGAFTPYSWANWSLILILYVFFVWSYATRSEPVSRARGAKETLFPLFCAVIPFALFETASLTTWPPIAKTPWLKPLFLLWRSHAPGDWSWPSILLLLSGNAIAVIGLFYLKQAFSIMTEARVHVKSGIYRFIRHPVYLGESLAMIGCCFIVPSWVNIALTGTWILLQRYRASLEEKKLEGAFPAYGTYRLKTGAYLPKLPASH